MTGEVKSVNLHMAAEIAFAAQVELAVISATLDGIAKAFDSLQGKGDPYEACRGYCEKLDAISESILPSLFNKIKSTVLTRKITSATNLEIVLIRDQIQQRLLCTVEEIQKRLTTLLSTLKYSDNWWIDHSLHAADTTVALISSFEARLKSLPEYKSEAERNKDIAKKQPKMPAHIKSLPEYWFPAFLHELKVYIQSAKDYKNPEEEEEGHGAMMDYTGGVMEMESEAIEQMLANVKDYNRLIDCLQHNAYSREAVLGEIIKICQKQFDFTESLRSKLDDEGYVLWDEFICEFGSDPRKDPRWDKVARESERRLFKAHVCLRDEHIRLVNESSKDKKLRS